MYITIQSWITTKRLQYFLNCHIIIIGIDNLLPDLFVNFSDYIVTDLTKCYVVCQCSSVIICKNYWDLLVERTASFKVIFIYIFFKVVIKHDSFNNIWLLNSTHKSMYEYNMNALYTEYRLKQCVLIEYRIIKE